MSESQEVATESASVGSETTGSSSGEAHTGFHTHRLAYTDNCRTLRLERAFAARWRLENERDQLLQMLMLTPAGQEASWSVVYRAKSPYYHAEITERDSRIVATVVQWLGTNVGFCFMEEALREGGYDIVRRKPELERSASDPQPALSVATTEAGAIINEGRSE